MDGSKEGKSRRGNAGKGRKVGSVNKLTMAAKEAFQHAFDESGGAEALATWARANRTEFYKLYGRLIPTDLNANVKVSPFTKILEEINGADTGIDRRTESGRGDQALTH